MSSHAITCLQNHYQLRAPWHLDAFRRTHRGNSHKSRSARSTGMVRQVRRARDSGNRWESCLSCLRICSANRFLRHGIMHVEGWMDTSTYFHAPNIEIGNILCNHLDQESLFHDI